MYKMEYCGVNKYVGPSINYVGSFNYILTPLSTFLQVIHNRNVSETWPPPLS